MVWPLLYDMEGSKSSVYSKSQPQPISCPPQMGHSSTSQFMWWKCKFCAAVRTALIRPGKFLLTVPDPFVINSAAIDARPGTAVRSQHFLTTKFASCAAIRNQLIQIVISFHAPIPSFLVVLKGDSHYTKIRWLIQASEIKCNVLVKLPKHDFSTASLERYARTTIYSILYIDSINILW